MAGRPKKEIKHPAYFTVYEDPIFPGRWNASASDSSCAYSCFNTPQEMADYVKSKHPSSDIKIRGKDA